MPASKPVSLQQVKADWLRVKHEMAYVRLLAAALRLKAILAREDKFNPYHDEAGRFTTADGAVSGGAGNEALTGGDGNERLGPGDPRRYSVNLGEEEVRGGHAIRDHVGKSDQELKTYLDQYVVRGQVGGQKFTAYKDAEGSFDSLEQANDIVNRLLQSDMATVDAVAGGSVEGDFIPYRFGFRTGKEAFREGPNEPAYIRPTYAAGVYIRHDTRSPRGFSVITAYPANERAK